MNFGKLDLLMRISFIILFMTDLYKDKHARACVHLSTFSLKNFSKTIDTILSLSHYQTKFLTGPNGNKLQMTFYSAFKMENKYHIG